MCSRTRVVTMLLETRFGFGPAVVAYFSHNYFGLSFMQTKSMTMNSWQQCMHEITTFEGDVCVIKLWHGGNQRKPKMCFASGARCDMSIIASSTEGRHMAGNLLLLPNTSMWREALFGDAACVQQPTCAFCVLKRVAHTGFHKCRIFNKIMFFFSLHCWRYNGYFVANCVNWWSGNEAISAPIVSTSTHI